MSFVLTRSLSRMRSKKMPTMRSILLRESSPKSQRKMTVPSTHRTHVNKGLPDPGNANRGRGASAFKDAGRLVYTLTPMSDDEAKLFDMGEDERRRLVRMDNAKVNIAPRPVGAKWFKLVGVPLGNRTDLYP